MSDRPKVTKVKVIDPQTGPDQLQDPQTGSDQLEFETGDQERESYDLGVKSFIFENTKTKKTETIKPSSPNPVPSPPTDHYFIYDISKADANKLKNGTYNLTINYEAGDSSKDHNIKVLKT